MFSPGNHGQDNKEAACSEGSQNSVVISIYCSYIPGYIYAVYVNIHVYIHIYLAIYNICVYTMCITHTCTDLLLSEEVPGPRASQGQNWKPELKVVWFGFKSDFCKS